MSERTDIVRIALVDVIDDVEEVVDLAADDRSLELESHLNAQLTLGRCERVKKGSGCLPLAHCRLRQPPRARRPPLRPARAGPGPRRAGKRLAQVRRARKRPPRRLRRRPARMRECRKTRLHRLLQALQRRTATCGQCRSDADCAAAAAATSHEQLRACLTNADCATGRRLRVELDELRARDADCAVPSAVSTIAVRGLSEDANCKDPSVLRATNRPTPASSAPARHCPSGKLASTSSA